MPPALVGGSFTTESPGEAPKLLYMCYLIWDNGYPQGVLTEHQSAVFMYHIYVMKGRGELFLRVCARHFPTYTILTTAVKFLTGTCRILSSHQALVNRYACLCPTHLLYPFPGAAVIRSHKLGGLKQWKSISPDVRSPKSRCWPVYMLFRGLEVQPSLLLQSFWWLPAILDISWLAATGLQVSAPAITWSFPLHFFVSLLVLLFL